MVRRCRQALCRHGDQGRVGNHHRPMNMNPRCWPPAFTAITGIKVTHDLIGEGDVVEKLQTQMQSGENIYDAYVNDSRPDRHALALPAGPQPDRLDGQRRQGRHQPDAGPALTSSASRSPRPRTASSTSCPTSSSRTSTGSATTGSTTQKNKDDFKAKYGYDLGVPVNWSAYEDIAEFFTGRDMSSSGQARSMATWTTARRTRRSAGASPTRGCRWPARATRAIPNGLPVDEWGIRVDENSRPVGSCVARGGDTNGPAAVYADDQVPRVAEEVLARRKRRA